MVIFPLIFHANYSLVCTLLVEKEITSNFMLFILGKHIYLDQELNLHTYIVKNFRYCCVHLEKQETLSVGRRHCLMFLNQIAYAS